VTKEKILEKEFHKVWPVWKKIEDILPKVQLELILNAMDQYAALNNNSRLSGIIPESDKPYMCSECGKFYSCKKCGCENNWLSLENEDNAGKVVDVYLKVYKNDSDKSSVMSPIIESYPKGLIDFLHEHQTKVGGKIVYDIPKHHKYMNICEAIEYYRNSNSL